MPYEDTVQIDPFDRCMKGQHGAFLCRRNAEHTKAAVRAVRVRRSAETSFEVRAA